MKFASFKFAPLALPFLIASLSYAEVAVPSTEVASSAVSARHYGVLDMQRIILSVDEGKEARAGLEKEIKAKEDELRKKKEELDKLNKEWKDQAPLLSEEARIKKQQDFQERLVTLRNSEMTFQNEIKQKEGQATQRIAMNVTSIVDGFAKEKSLDLVFELNSSGLLYAKNPVDLTDLVIKKYNENSKKGLTAPKAGKAEASKPTTNKKPI